MAQDLQHGQGLSLRRGVFSLPTAISLSLGVALLVSLAVRFDLDISAVWRAITRSNPLLYGLGFLMYYLGLLVRGYRWKVILRNGLLEQEQGRRLPSTLACTQFILLGRFADSVAWFRLGNLYRAYLVAEVSGGSFSRTLGTVVAEHVLDIMVVLVLLVGMALLVISRGEFLSFGALIGVSFALVALAALVLGLMWRFGPRVARHLPRRLQGVYQRFHEGALKGFGQLPLVLGLSVAGWVCGMARWYLVALALGLPLSFPMVLFITLGNAVLAAVPLTPGGLGVVEPGVTGLLLLRLSPEEAAAVALLERSISYLSVLALGGLLFLGWEVSRRWQAVRQGVRIGMP